ncbi:MAG: Gfo/Idh/MocA family oxidoreductase, partial [Armatimonadetes bacterium]|nr:Gfo/Idh/MocA family oxidoreductase [Armatimonadota bacterium]
MSGKLAWGIIGSGSIAGVFAEGVAGSKTGELVAVGSRAQAGADRFGEKYNVPRRHGSYEALLADDGLEAVYIATPHPIHAEWAIKAAEAGKHILCEKPLTLNHAEALVVIEAARANDVFLMEAFMYRCHPQTAKLVELVREGAIGEIRLIQATFSFQATPDPKSRLFSQELGGGGILDVGCYAASMARLIAGAAAGKDFEEPVEVRGTAHIGDVTRIDEYATASLRFPGGALAQLATGVHMNGDNVVRITGSEGSIFVPNPWMPSRAGGSGTILILRQGQDAPEENTVETDRGLYSIEADTVAENIERRQARPPAMTWDDTLGNMKTLDRWRQAIGLVYDSERPEAQVLPVSKRPLAVRADQKMKYGSVAGVEKPVARVVMGMPGEATMPSAAMVFDDYFSRGGN